MDLDELFSKRSDDPLVQLLRQDLDRFSVGELNERIGLLEGEIARVRARLQATTSHRAAAEALFKGPKG